MLTSRISNIARKFSTSVVRQGGHGGVPGENLPFGFNNRYLFTLAFTAYLAIPFSIPFFVVRHQLLKQ